MVSVFDMDFDEPKLPPHITTCRHCIYGHVCENCDKEVFCVQDFEYYDPDEPFPSTECKNYSCRSFPMELNKDDEVCN